MSDSFADLWSTTAPLPPKAKPQTLSAVSASSSTGAGAGAAAQPTRPYGASKPDLFAMLSAPSAGSGSGSGARYGLTASAPTSRAMTPAGSRASPALAPGTRGTTPQLRSQPVSKADSGDAFGDLFAPAAGAGAGGAGMTLAARLKQEAQLRAAHAPAMQAKTAGDGGAWAGLDALGAGLAAQAMPATGGRVDDADDWGLLGDFGGAQPAGGAQKQAQRAAGTVGVDDADDWGLGDFGQPQPQPQAGGGRGRLAQEQEQGQGQYGDDILGVLGAPVPSASARRREASPPPPHALAQIVQMGFTVAQAKGALAKTAGGADVQAALESLLAGDQPAVSQPAPAKKTPGKTLWDLDDFATPSDGITRSQSDSPVPSKPSGARTKVASVDEAFDFGAREDYVDEERRSHPARGKQRGLLDLSDDEHGDDGLTGGRDHDDILAEFAAPRTKAQQRRPSPASASSSGNAARAPSPPPHVLGQIVEMGFSVQQARAALAKTPGGLDVAAALESLLAGSSATPPPAPAAPPTATAAVRGAPKGQKERERARLERLRAQDGAGAGTAGGVAEIQEQADKLLAQASEIGLSVFSKASAMWGKGKERVVKAYEERTGAERDEGARRGGAVGRGRGDGRPRWMQDAGAPEEEMGAAGFQDDHKGFADDDEDHDATQHAPVKQQKILHEEPPSLLQHEEEVDLFAPVPVAVRAAAPVTTPVQRRPPPSRQVSAVSSSSRSVPTSATPPIPIPERALPSASPASLATALKHRTAGTDAFKLGQYAAAADAYTAALAALPTDHLLRVPLHTNRAIARMRNGDYRGAEEDCTRALGVVLGAGEEALLGEGAAGAAAQPGLRWSPAALPPSLAPNAARAWAHAQGHGADLGDAYVKALKRRAEAREGRERWAAAMGDWEALAACAWAPEGVRADAARGRARCRGLVGGAGAGAGAGVSAGAGAPAPAPAARPASKPKPRPAPRPPAASSGKALAALQSANAAAEADEAARFALKDAVDARLAGWRKGKETNIRALLCTLDAVLWDAVLAGARVGMSEVVSAPQVKRAYVRAVARVHPDKLNPTNSTVEQRMLANAVFGTLNEAWIAFQASQK